VQLKAVIFGIGVAITGSSHAQPAAGSTHTLYGIVDAGVEHLSNVGAARNSVTRMPSLTGTLPSRWGIRATEDLGDGLQAVFTLESGFAPDSGTLNQGGRAFGRQAFVGLAGAWGAVTLGRQNTMLFWSLLDADQLGPNNFGLASHDSYIPNARADNAVAYRGRFGGFTLGGTYSLGRDAVNAGPSPAGTNCAGESATDSRACREWSALLKYDTPAWGVALAVDDLRGGPGAFAGLVRSQLRDRRAVANGYVKLGSWKLSAGTIRRNNDGAAALSATNGQGSRSSLSWLAAGYSITPLFVVEAHLQHLAFSGDGDTSKLAVARATYLLSKRTAVYAQAGHISNGPRLAFSLSSGQPGGNPPAGTSQDGMMVGMRHSF
jgi:predicted porin